MADASKSVFELPEFKHYQNRFHERANRFQRYRLYYSGKIYDDSNFKLLHKLYAETKALFSFLARAVDLDVAFVPGMMGPWALADGTPQAIITAQKTLYEWSSWDTEGDSWLEDGATCGVAMIKVVPDESTRQIRLQRLRPELCLLTLHLDPSTGQISDLALIVDRGATDHEGKQYEYAEAITPAEIRTYRNGQPHGFHGNPDRYPNPLEFVPVVETKNDAEARPSFARALPQVDSANEMASYLGDIIGRHIEPQWFAAGVEPGDFVKDGKNVWVAPSPDAKIDALIAEIDIPGTLAFVQEIKGETKSNLPELAFDDLRAKDQIATETLKVQLIELYAKTWKMRRRYDAGMVDAHRLAALAAITYGYGELATLLAPHGFDWERPVLPKSRLEMIREEEAELNLELLRSATQPEGLTALLTPGGQGAVPEAASSNDSMEA